MVHSACNCGRTDWHSVKCWIENGILKRRCDLCSDFHGKTLPDVFFDKSGYVETLTDPNDPSTWEKGTFVRSRVHKAEVMKKLGVREAGDKVGGSRNFDPISHRYGHESLRKHHG